MFYNGLATTPKSNFLTSNLKLEWLFTPDQPNCIWYIDSPSICSPLPLVGFYQSLKISLGLNLKHVIHFWHTNKKWTFFVTLFTTILVTSCFLYWIGSVSNIVYTNAISLLTRNFNCCNNETHSGMTRKQPSELEKRSCDWIVKGSSLRSTHVNEIQKLSKSKKVVTYFSRGNLYFFLYLKI